MELDREKWQMEKIGLNKRLQEVILEFEKKISDEREFIQNEYENKLTSASLQVTKKVLFYRLRYLKFCIASGL